MDIWASLSWFTAHPVWSVVIGFVAFIAVVSFIEGAGVYAGYVLVATVAVLFAWIGDKWLYLWVFLLGMATAFTEIIGKFRDEPLKSFRTREALIYHVFNGLASVFALKVLLLYGWSVTDPLDRVKAVVTAGLGAMLFMRSRLFNVKVDKEDLSFGPEQFVKAFMGFMEQAIGRVRAQARVDFVNEVMGNVKASAVKEYVVTMLGAVQLLENRSTLVADIENACNASKNEQYKAYDLGYLLLDQGEDFVRKLFANKNDHPEWLISAPRQQPTPEGIVTRAKAKMGLLKTEGPVAYFAYGENMASQRLAERLNWTKEAMLEEWGQTKNPTRAILRQYERVFGKVNMENTTEVRATIMPNEMAEVEGVLYWLPPKALKFLDAPYVPGYRRAAITVEIPDPQGAKVTVEAETYLADVAETASPSPDYLRTMLVGAREHGLSPTYVKQLADNLKGLAVPA